VLGLVTSGSAVRARRSTSALLAGGSALSKYPSGTCFEAAASLTLCANSAALQGGSQVGL